MKRTITDADVAGLDLQRSRAELLEEIMSIDPQHSAVPFAEGRGPRRQRWLPALAAAVVVAVVAGATWFGAQDRDVQPAPAKEPSAGAAGRALLDAEGWTLEAMIDDQYGGELSYVRGQRYLTVHWRPAAEYDDYYRDRAEIGPEVEIEVLGKPSAMWAYSADDHTVIRPVEGGYSLEVRGQGMGRAAFRALLGQLRLVDESELEAALPGEAIRDAERPDQVAALLEELPVPDGFDRAAVTSQALQRYHLIADVTGAVTCAWIAQFLDAQAAGDEAAITQAQQSLAGARDWTVLREIEDQGGWSGVLWHHADLVVRGASAAADRDMLADYEGALGCDD